MKIKYQERRALTLYICKILLTLL